MTVVCLKDASGLSSSLLVMGEADRTQKRLNERVCLRTLQRIDETGNGVLAKLRDVAEELELKDLRVAAMIQEVEDVEVDLGQCLAHDQDLVSVSSVFA
jgi:hypothetical protein